MQNGLTAVHCKTDVISTALFSTVTQHYHFNVDCFQAKQLIHAFPLDTKLKDGCKTGSVNYVLISQIIVNIIVLT